MANHGRFRPSNLQVECIVCSKMMPYNPTSLSLCADCESKATEPVREDIGGIMSHQRLSSPSYSSQMPRMSLSSTINSYQQSEILSGHTPNDTDSSPTVRRTIVGPAAKLHDYEMTEDSDDEFMDAHEEMKMDEDEKLESNADTPQNEFTNEGDAQGEEQAIGETEDEQGDAMDYNQATAGTEDQTQDLFAMTFTNTSGENSDGESEKDEQEEKVQPVKGPKKGSHKAKKEPEVIEIISEGEHESTKRSSTRSTPFVPCLPKPPHPEKDLSTILKELRDFHNRAKEFIPRLPLADHRYWIGVLNMGVRARTANHEKHFTWMKGNRFTTVRTVWHMYQNATATEDFALLLGREKVNMTDKVEELDYFNDKKVVFRVVERRSLEAKGVELCEGVVPAESVAGKDDKKKSSELIELVDDDNDDGE